MIKIYLHFTFFKKTVFKTLECLTSFTEQRKNFKWQFQTSKSWRLISQVKFSLLAEQPYSPGANSKIKGWGGKIPGLISTVLTTSESQFRTGRGPWTKKSQKTVQEHIWSYN